MTHHATPLPHLTGEIVLTDGGIETTLIFEERIDLPYFAAFDLLKSEAGSEALRRYYRRHAAIAAAQGAAFILESATWRASPDWGAKLGYSATDMVRANRGAIALLEEVRREFPQLTTVISGCVGPRGDGYSPGALMSASAAETYHAAQISAFAGTAAEMVTAITMTNVPEAIGIVQAATAASLPVVISFTVETDGRLPDGTALGDAILAVDEATCAAAAYFMLNCAHPDHFRDRLAEGGDWVRRLCGLRANASRLSHAELDEAEVLDCGNPVELARDYAELRKLLPNLVVLGGCCGTDHRHIHEIGAACAPVQAA